MRSPQTLAPRRCYYAWLTGAALVAVAGAAPTWALPPTTRGPAVQGPEGGSEYPRVVLDGPSPAASRPDGASRRKADSSGPAPARRAPGSRLNRNAIASSATDSQIAAHPGGNQPVLFVRAPRVPAPHPADQIVPGQLPTTQPARSWVSPSNETGAAEGSGANATPASSDVGMVPLPGAPTVAPGHLPASASVRSTPAAVRPARPGRAMAALPKSMQPSLVRPPLTPSELLEEAAYTRSRNFRLAQRRINYSTFSGGTPYQKLVALTFDDGPDPLQTPRVLQVLRKHKVTATFFVIGGKVDRYPELTRRMAAEGHDLGNHTYHHYNLTTFNDAGIRFQVERTSQAIEKAVGGPTRWFRAPGCRYTPEVLRMLRELDMVRVDTTNNTGDWGKRDPAAMVRSVMNRLKPGDVILCHDRLPLTTKALPSLIRAVRARGYRFVSLAELAQRAQAANFSPKAWPVNQGIVLDDPRRQKIKLRSKRKVRFAMTGTEMNGLTVTDSSGLSEPVEPLASVRVAPARRQPTFRRVRRRHHHRARLLRRAVPQRAPHLTPTVQSPAPSRTPVIPRTVVVPGPARVKPTPPRAPVGRVPSSVLTGLTEG